MNRRALAPEPPVELPPGRPVHVPDRGEIFVRDSAGDGPPVLPLHGWMFQSDLNWYRCYGPLAEAGHRVLAIDHPTSAWRRALRVSEALRAVGAARSADPARA